MSTCVPSDWTGPRVSSPQPAIWNNGIECATVSAARMPIAVAANLALLVRPRCVSTAPFGRPVVPEV